MAFRSGCTLRDSDAGCLQQESGPAAATSSTTTGITNCFFGCQTGNDSTRTQQRAGVDVDND